MINLAVVNLKDFGKLILKLTIIIILLWFFSNMLLKNKNDLQISFLQYEIKNINLINIIENQIPQIKQLMQKVNNKTKDNNILVSGIKNPTGFILETQLAVTNNLIKKEEDSNNVNEKNNNINDDEIIEHAQTGLETHVVENDVKQNYTNTYKDVYVKNGTDYELTEEMLTPNIEVNSKDIIIFHTHTCESYTPSEKYNYNQTGTYRTTDLNYSVARVGEELTKQLESYNYNVIHDTTYHDYPAYTGSYERSLDTVKNILANHQETDVIFDIHRDAISDYSYAPKVKIGDEYAAQLMFVIGTDGGGLEHPNWMQNLKFAIKIQEKANDLYPGLFKPIILRNSRYNQHLAKAASIIEVGATGNTMDECLISMKYLARVISEII